MSLEPDVLYNFSILPSYNIFLFTDPAIIRPKDACAAPGTPPVWAWEGKETWRQQRRRQQRPMRATSLEEVADTA